MSHVHLRRLGSRAGLQTIGCRLSPDHTCRTATVLSCFPRRMFASVRWTVQEPTSRPGAAAVQEATWRAEAGDASLGRYLQECRELVVREIRRIIPSASPCSAILYDLMLVYPLRAAKALRPAICIATCRALGGRLELVLPSAAVLELYHNAFLIHDDVEDLSEKRRDQSTLHEAWGMPIAVNVGDAMLALALMPLLDNMRLVGMGKALRILQALAEMARETAEGQAIELAWIRENVFDQGDDDYERMVEKKTSYYSFMTPMNIGAIAAGVEPDCVDALLKFARPLGVAFQIQDDILNLAADESRYGKEIAGDLWEGKHTLILLHAIRSSTPSERARAQAVLAKARPRGGKSLQALTGVEAAIDDLVREGELSPRAEATLRERTGRLRASVSHVHKTSEDIAFLSGLIERQGSLEYARGIAAKHGREAKVALEALSDRLGPSVHRSFLAGLAEYVSDRDR